MSFLYNISEDTFLTYEVSRIYPMLHVVQPIGFLINFWHFDLTLTNT